MSNGTGNLFHFFSTPFPVTWNLLFAGSIRYSGGLRHFSCHLQAERLTLSSYFVVVSLARQFKKKQCTNVAHSVCLWEHLQPSITQRPHLAEPVRAAVPFQAAQVAPCRPDLHLTLALGAGVTADSGPGVVSSLLLCPVRRDLASVPVATTLHARSQTVWQRLPRSLHPAAGPFP